MVKYAILAAIVVLTGTTALWMKNVGAPYLWSVGAAMIVAVGVLSMLFLGDGDTAYQRAAGAVGRVVTDDPRVAGAVLALLVAAIGVTGWKAWETLPVDRAALSVAVYREHPRPGNFAVGAEVVLASVEDGASWSATVDDRGIARLSGFAVPTTFMLNIVELRGGTRWSASSGLRTLDALPASDNFDLAEIAEDAWFELAPDGLPAGATPPAGHGGGAETIGDTALQAINAPWGVPEAALIVNRYGYILGIDPARRGPVWAAFAVAEPRNEIRIDRDQQFRPDPAVPIEFQAERSEYRRSGFDRGHLVSPREMRFKGEVAIREAGYLTALTPQLPQLNRFTWNRLEQAIMALAARLDRQVFVVNGPLHDADGPRQTIGPRDLPVPAGFFSVIAWIGDDGALGLAGYRFSNVEAPSRDFQDHAVPVAEIEAETGLTLLPALADQIGADRAAELKASATRLPGAQG